MKEIIFHIGTHKTGTTSLQHTLHDAGAALSGLGVYYPQAGRIGREGHHNLVYELVSGWRFRPALGGWDALEAELRDRDDPVVLISSESLSGYRTHAGIPERCAALARALGRRPRIVACLRPQFAYLESIYAQNAATGYTAMRFERYLLDSIARDAADYGAVLHNWQARFGSCEVFAFRPGPDRPPVAQLLRDVLGIDLPATIPEQRANDRRGVRAVEFARKTTEIQEHNDEPVAARTALAKRVSDICARMWPNEPRFAAMDGALAKIVQAIFADRNRALFAQYPHLEEPFDAILAGHDRAVNALDLDNAGPNLRREFDNVIFRALRQSGGKGKGGDKGKGGAGGGDKP